MGEVCVRVSPLVSIPVHRARMTKEISAYRNMRPMGLTSISVIVQRYIRGIGT